MRFLADTLERAVVVSDEPELTAMGTAALAARGAGLPPAPIPSGRRIEPQPQAPGWRTRFAAAREAVAAFGVASIAV